MMLNIARILVIPIDLCCVAGMCIRNELDVIVGGLDNVAIGPSVDVDDLEGYRLVLYNTINHVT